MSGTGGLCISIRVRIVIQIRIQARLTTGPWFCQSPECQTRAAADKQLPDHGRRSHWRCRPGHPDFEGCFSRCCGRRRDPGNAQKKGSESACISLAPSRLRAAVPPVRHKVIRPTSVSKYKNSMCAAIREAFRMRPVRTMVAVAGRSGEYRLA
jgi:hypothetical protein